MTINITPIPAFNDNYIWAITEKDNNNVILVDPGDFNACVRFLEEQRLTVSAILVTHHHHDHVGAIEQLATIYNPDVVVYGPANEEIPRRNIALHEGDTVKLATFKLTLNVLEVPGHTAGHIVYFNDDILFCGDTLFSGGCGRLVEGTPAQMHHSLTKLAKLPASTKVYCTHEYTLANLQFALAVEPENLDLLNYYNQVKALRDQGRPSLPSNLALECKINPFLRCDYDSVKEAAALYSDSEVANASYIAMSEVDVFATIRAWKDNF